MGKEKARKFSGELNGKGYAEDPDVWLRHYLRVCASNGWNTDEEKLGHVALCLKGEAEVWYDINSRWIEQAGTTWAAFEQQFLERFRPVNYRKELLDRLRTPAQREGESIRSYGDRYRRLYEQAAPPHSTIDDYKDDWVSGLNGPLKKEVLLSRPGTFDEAVVQAIEIEKVELTIKRDSRHFRSGKRPTPKAKGYSADIVAAEDLADVAAGLTDNNPEEGDQEKKRSRLNLPGEETLDKLAKDISRLVMLVERKEADVNGDTRIKSSKPKAPEAGRSQRERNAACWTCGSFDHYAYRCPKGKPFEKGPRKDAHVTTTGEEDNSDLEDVLEALPAEKRKARTRFTPHKKPREELPNEDEDMAGAGIEAEEKRKKKIIAFVKNLKDGNFSDAEMRSLALTLSQIPSGESFMDRLNSSSKTRAAMRRGLRLVEEEANVDAKAAPIKEKGSAVYCSANIEGVDCRVIIDSGSGVFIIPESMLRKMGRKIERPCKYSLSTANGEVRPHPE
jgi:hypothetical protein